MSGAVGNPPAKRQRHGESGRSTPDAAAARAPAACTCAAASAAASAAAVCGVPVAQLQQQGPDSDIVYNPAAAPLPVGQPHALHVPGPPDAAVAQAGSWRLNLGRTSGFWGDARWYDLQIDRKLGLVAEMLDELVLALPPMTGKRAADLCGGSGKAALAMLQAYPEAHATVVDMDRERMAIASAAAGRLGLQGRLETVLASVSPDTMVGQLPGGPPAGCARLS